MDRNLYVVKSEGWERDAVERIMDDFPDYVITEIGDKKPCIEASAGPSNGNYRTVLISPVEGASLMVFLSDMKGGLKEGLLPVLAYKDKVRLQYKKAIFEISMK